VTKETAPQSLAMLVSVLALWACSPQQRPEVIHVESSRQPWVQLQFGKHFCYLNLHWTDSTDTELISQRFGEWKGRRSAMMDGALTIDSISQDVVVGLERDFAGECDLSILADKFLGIGALEISEASPVTETDWHDARASRNDLICRQKVATSLSEADLTGALERLGEQQQGGILQTRVTGGTAELELYRNCGLPEREREPRYRSLIERFGK
jgi:hypothetical protein